MAGRSLELFFIDGTPDGMRTADLFNWTGHVLMTPRTRLDAALRRSEAKRTGVYILLDNVETCEKAYVGESENVATRMKNHDARKDWWEHAVIVTSHADGLHKAHVKYLESRLVEIALGVGRTALENGNTPPRSSLSEAAASNMEAFLANLRMVLPALGVRVFQEDARPSGVGSPSIEGAMTDGSAQSAEPILRFLLKNTKRGVEAAAILEGSDFVLERGSLVRSAWDGQAGHSYQRLLQALANRGLLEPLTDGLSRIRENYAFRSPSAAAAIVNGRQANGRVEWKHATTGMTFADWEKQQLGNA